MSPERLPAGADRRHGAPMRSLVNWALLGLIIERPSYAYELAQRFARRFGKTLQVSNIGHIYTALGALGERGLVEEIPGTREGRQPKPRYRATGSGQEQYRRWLVEQVGEDRRRHQLFVLALGALARDPEAAMEVMDLCEQAWLQEGMKTPIPAVQEDSVDVVAALLREMICEENRLAVGTKLEWIQYVRARLARLRRQ